jgi:hypothetical protein
MAEGHFNILREMSQSAGILSQALCDIRVRMSRVTKSNKGAIYPYTSDQTPSWI